MDEDWNKEYKERRKKGNRERRIDRDIKER
jgi:hypothetical protein